MRISTKGRGIIKAQQGTVARPNPKENKHSRLLKQIRIKAQSFPSDLFCLNEAAKDDDISPYMKSDEFEVTIGNLREYQD